MADLGSPCVHCAVGVGEPCRDEGGRRLTTTHAGRGRAPAAPDPFDAAALYDACDHEAYHHTTVVAAVTEYVDGALSPHDEDPATEILGMAVTVIGYSPRAVGNLWIDRVSGHLAEQLEEWWAEEYGDPDGDHTVDIKAAAAALRVAIAVIAAKTPVWQCDAVGRRTYEGEQLLEMMRKAHPHWFERKAAGRG